MIARQLGLAAERVSHASSIFPRVLRFHGAGTRHEVKGKHTHLLPIAGGSAGAGQCSARERVGVLEERENCEGRVDVVLIGVVWWRGRRRGVARRAGDAGGF